jgi:3-mercaptopyruvate sulfurtransferase SseA
VTRWFPTTIAVIAALLLGAIAFSLMPRPVQTALVSPWSPTPTPLPDPARVPRMAIETARHLPGALFVDVRSGVEYELGHIPGAISIPARDVDQSLGKMPKERTIVFYCT